MSATTECGNCRYFQSQGNGYAGRCRWLESLPKGIGYDLLRAYTPLGDFPATSAGDVCDHHREELP